MTRTRITEYRQASPDSLDLGASGEIAGSIGTLSGYGLKWNTYALINSAAEGRFVEKFSPQSLSKSVRENGDKVRLMYSHGRDAMIGDRLLGPLTVTVDAIGLRYTSQLFDTEYNRELLPSLRSGLLGSSISFSVLVDQFKQRPGKSSYNPLGWPERTIQEAKLKELSVVTWPAYASSSAQVRSATDSHRFLLATFKEATE